ncbi:MAG: DNA-processing protein DprA [Kiritimatiellae bacterium]|nr:DNA-processing protein DprA [Kiritimatiellia bacterium]
MTEREARIAFNMIPTVGAVTLARLMRETHGSAAAAYEFYPEKKDWEGKVPAWEREIEQAAQQHVRLVTDLDADYPPQLREIASPPLVLYVVGDVSVLSKPGVSLVGTRKATAYGREMAKSFAAGLARAGWAVFSGLALGIDAAAHEGALAGGGVTAGVLGGALDMFYPEANRALARRMVENGGCVVSEFPFGRRPDAQTFPQRNRIVSGLARGVVAVECPLRSGTLVTCLRANEQGRAVMAVPGRIDWPSSAGCLNLIREGARMVTCVDDVIEELTPIAQKKVATSATAPAEGVAIDGQATGRAVAPRPPKPPIPEVKLSIEEALVLRQVPAAGATLDAVARAAQLPVAKTNALLVALRLKGRVRFLPGNRVASR